MTGCVQEPEGGEKAPRCRQTKIPLADSYVLPVLRDADVRMGAVVGG
jgi:hypothetical protein